MAYERNCPNCHRTVTCREERQQLVEGADHHVIRLFCPHCGRRIGSVYPTLH
jgi:endogenous inhibitor of DNA gyrase (YacG/DUF329 family)